MKTYTLFTTPPNIIEEHLPHKYNMELNKKDMLNLLEVLSTASQFNEPSGDSEIDEWPMNFRSSILTTIGIEEI